jgi:hypothetical protein
MDDLYLNTFYDIYDNECDKSNDLLTTKIVDYFNARSTERNKTIVAEKVDAEE